MLSSNLYLLATGLTLSTAFARPNVVRRDETPQLPHDPNTTPYCTWWADDDGSTKCADIPGYWGISMEDFVRWNPSVGNDCAGYVSGNSYCVEAYGEPAPGTGTTTTKVTTTSSATTSSATASSTTTSSTTTSSTTITGGAPGPTQSGQVTNCNKWDLVQSGDTCSVYLTKYPGLTLAKLVEWNPAIGSQCESLWVDTYICTGITGWTPSPTTSKATTTSATPTNGITTPQPIQPGMIADCNKFHMVADGDGCDSIAKANGITPAQFYSLNPGVGNTCSTLWLGYYVCVSRIGDTAPTTTKATTTTTKPTNGIATPTPIQNGMVGNCDKFHLVGDNDQCVTIVSSNGISLSQFYSWNPAVGKGCETLWKGYYVCVKIIGVTPITTTKATTTTAGNGIATPTPIQPGMITSCKKFHKVVAGDQCGTIAAAAGISQTQFFSWNPNVGSDCKSLWLGYWVCTGK
ncbi:Peptidoglycan-binding Lysin subgroup [Penicillium cf. griseofulvum]|uniref:Peptidoglycan-binding Lysin subgroup n=1 Tax=Penicillium cf. griseofulvum TaxID=2972120 RepID=A0A9W9IUI6_9EURO|nr:Peptidoglycan-binding Lysin subgroup [Penicillium cf. griseofulvum]KAJ5429805.1 Peptidoglycan-binding Lysin subgroup [Penicillium cf. griseofulvum]KAJ5436425.1 Peptidoglycan-binding Lysin subgroup [Penicillium cf. griseofulvum]